MLQNKCSGVESILTFKTYLIPGFFVDDVSKMRLMYSHEL